MVVNWQGLYVEMRLCTQISIPSKTFLFSAGSHLKHIKGQMSTVVSSKSPSTLGCCTDIPVRSVETYSHIPARTAQSSASSTPSSCYLKMPRQNYYGSNMSRAVSMGKTSACCSAQADTRFYISSRDGGAHGTKVSPRSGIQLGSKCSMAEPFRGSRGHQRVFPRLLFGLLVCYCSSADYVHAEEPKDDTCKEQKYTSASSLKTAHGKTVYTDYSIIGIPGDGRCLFRSVAHGACSRSGTSPPSESLQRELADELRALVADEFIKRREETEWFIEGDFDCYVGRMRNPHVWGGEPELLMLSHVLRTPITVFMRDEEAGGLISIAEYGQEYGNKENPIRVMYHGFGHYDALLIPGRRGTQSRL